MSLRYRDSSGNETIVSGLTPGGDIEAGAVMTRTGTFTSPAVNAQASATLTVTFDTPMPDNDYIIDLEMVTYVYTLEMTVFAKTATGFGITFTRATTTPAPADANTCRYIATKTYTVQHAAQNAEDIANIKATIPSTASSTNQLTPKKYVDDADTALDGRVSDLEDLVPTGASVTNQLATKAEIDNVYTKTEVDTKLDDKQDTLTFDTTPTAGSNNPVTSAGIKSAIDNVPIPTVSNPNLLDNWYFIGGGSQQGSGHFPINQRGLTQYSATRYGIDRWKCTNSNTNSIITINSDSIDFQNGTNGTSFEHFFENIDHIKGRTVTLSALVKHISGSGFSGVQMGYITQPGGTISWTEMSGTAVTSQSSEYTIVYVSANIPDDAVDLYPRFRNTVALDVGSIKAIKLEYGDCQTLAKRKNDKWVLNDTAPNYATELLKCQRYYYEINNDNGATWMPLGLVHFRTVNQCCCLLPLPVPMRSAPTVVLSLEATTISYPMGAATDVTPTAASVNSTNPYAVSLTLSVTETATVNTCGELWLKTGTAGKISFSADL